MAQSPTSSSSLVAPDQDQAGQTAGETQGQLSVQARIRARRAQRRAAAIHDAYAHLYEAYTGMGYLRFVPGPGYPASDIHHCEWLTAPAWSARMNTPGTSGLTRYYSERLGVTVDGRGYYGTAYVGLQPNNPNYVQGITNPAISQYAALIGPTYRFYLQPKYSVSGRVMGGFSYGNFSSDTNHSTILSTDLGLWPDGSVFAASASIPVEYNMTPNVGFRVAPEFYMTGFGSTEQKSLGFTLGIVYRFGKQ